MKTFDYPQGSPEWAGVRLGRPTASQFGRIILPNGKRSGQARKYLYDLCWERLSGRSAARDVSHIGHVQYGVSHEDEAADAFAKRHGVELQRASFCISDDGRIGCSPDRLITGQNSAVEIKCPSGPVHIGNMLDGPENYRPQIAGQMLVCGFGAVYLWSYRDDAPAYEHKFMAWDMQSYMRDLVAYLNEFLAALDEATIALRAKGGWQASLSSEWPDDDAA